MQLECSYQDGLVIEESLGKGNVTRQKDRPFICGQYLYPGTIPKSRLIPTAGW